MATNYVIPHNMPRYLKRVSGFYRQNGQTGLADVLDNSKFRVVEETDFDGWDGGSDGHDVIFYVPDPLLKLRMIQRGESGRRRR